MCSLPPPRPNHEILQGTIHLGDSNLINFDLPRNPATAGLREWSPDIGRMRCPLVFFQFLSDDQIIITIHSYIVLKDRSLTRPPRKSPPEYSKLAGIRRNDMGRVNSIEIFLEYLGCVLSLDVM